MIKKTKKILTLLLAGLLIISSMSVISVSATVSATAPAVSIGSAEITQGEDYETVSLPVKFEGSVKASTLQVQVEYDENVEFVSYTAGDCYAAGAFFSVPPIAGARPVNISLMDLSYLGVQVSSGTFATLEFKVPKSTVKDYEFGVSVVSCQASQDGTFTQIADTFKTANGVVSVKSATPDTPVVPAVPAVSIGSAEITQGEDYETVSLPVKFEGSVKASTLQVQVEYDENVEFVSYTAGDCYAAGAFFSVPPIAGARPVNISLMDLSYLGVQVSSGTFATLEFKVPKSTVKDYEFGVSVVSCQASQDGTFTQIADTFKTVNGKVTVKGEPVTGPVVTFTDASGATVEDVVEGTMNMSVALNGDTSDLIMFAIYTKEGDFAVMKYQTNATIENGVATAQLQNITLENGKNYYAKAFIWDAATYYGSVVTLGE